MLRRRLCSPATFAWLNRKLLSNEYDKLLLDELVKDHAKLKLVMMCKAYSRQ